MNVELLSIGKTKSAYISEGIAEYLRRLKHYIPFETVELTDIKNSGKISPTEQKEAEGRLILARLTGADHVVLLDERGREFTSPAFAERLQTILASGKKRLIMIIGGPYGFSKDVYNRANDLISLSKMTFNHEMVRLFTMEQIYRAMTILKGEPYHHA